MRITDGSYHVLSYEESSGDAIITVYFTPLMTSDSGRYICSVDITQTTIDYQDVFYESFSVNTTSECALCFIGVGTRREPGAPALPSQDVTNINLVPPIPTYGTTQYLLPSLFLSYLFNHLILCPLFTMSLACKNNLIIYRVHIHS